VVVEGKSRGRHKKIANLYLIFGDLLTGNFFKCIETAANPGVFLRRDHRGLGHRHATPKFINGILPDVQTSEIFSRRDRTRGEELDRRSISIVRRLRELQRRVISWGRG